MRRCPVTGKSRYRDRIAAELAIATMQNPRRASTERHEKRAYRCEHCGGWHVTSQGRGRRGFSK